MAKRKIVKINEDKCNGCALCIPNCHEGALQMIDGKARLISDLFCDGLGACIGHCPQGAITTEEREAEPYDEKKVMKENIIPKGENIIKAHLEHLREHGADEYLKDALEYLEEKGMENPMKDRKMEMKNKFCGCPGSKEMDFSGEGETISGEGKRASQLRQWPVQLHLISTHAPYYQGKDLLLAADCTAYALGDFHKDLLKGRSLAIACPKLDEAQDVYLEKLTRLIDDSKINTLTVAIMEVPCCSGLLQLAKNALEKSGRKIPIKAIIVGIHGDVKSEEWI
ncbi:4Fe-4S ferredoxin [Candidatus Woesearchaeota archaeon]|nr:4Fe-4S ferredoxin [Candidatus Woesearchaeota archaeon]